MTQGSVCSATDATPALDNNSGEPREAIAPFTCGMYEIVSMCLRW